MPPKTKQLKPEVPVQTAPSKKKKKEEVKDEVKLSPSEETIADKKVKGVTKPKKTETKKAEKKAEVKTETKTKKTRVSSDKSGLSMAHILRIAMKAGASRSSKKVEPAINRIYHEILEDVLYRSAVLAANDGRITIKARHVERAVQGHGYKLYPNAVDNEYFNANGKDHAFHAKEEHESGDEEEEEEELEEEENMEEVEQKVEKEEEKVEKKKPKKSSQKKSTQ